MDYEGSERTAKRFVENVSKLGKEGTKRRKLASKYEVKKIKGY